MKLAIRGVVKELASRRRFFFFKKPYLLIDISPDDIRKVEREVNARFPGYGSLGSHGCAVDFEQLENPSDYPVGQRVEMTVSIGSPIEEYFFGAAPLGLDSVRPLTTT